MTLPGSTQLTILCSCLFLHGLFAFRVAGRRGGGGEGNFFPHAFYVGVMPAEGVVGGGGICSLFAMFSSTIPGWL